MRRMSPTLPPMGSASLSARAPKDHRSSAALPHAIASRVRRCHSPAHVLRGVHYAQGKAAPEADGVHVAFKGHVQYDVVRGQHGHEGREVRPALPPACAREPRRTRACSGDEYVMHAPWFRHAHTLWMTCVHATLHAWPQRHWFSTLAHVAATHRKAGGQAGRHDHPHEPSLRAVLAVRIIVL